jgi:hypothetical protein
MIYKYSGSFRGILMEINHTVPIVDEYVWKIPLQMWETEEQ